MQIGNVLKACWVEGVTPQCEFHNDIIACRWWAERAVCEQYAQAMDRHFSSKRSEVLKEDLA